MPRVAKLTVSFVLITLLLGILAACGTSTPPLGLSPSKQLVQKAIALQVSLTQQQLTQSLQSLPPKFEITQVTLKGVEPLLIDDLPTYHFQGTYTLKFRLSKRQVNQRNNPFDVYLQRQLEGKTWRLALCQKTNGGTPDKWRTYLIR
ncbi:hypothetical protein [Lyngbya aestuarii]|uniref:hypothetical protein n=1 Tax=Lyngbya aestuarii TaxID=118322 RepID=UPI00403E1407